MLCVGCCLACVVRCMQPVVCYVLSSARRFVGRLLLAVCGFCLLSGVRCLLSVACCLLLVVCKVSCALRVV